MAQLSKCFLTGDFTKWPLDQETVAEVVRVRMVRTRGSGARRYRELRVRSRVVKGMANIYMERHIQDLGKRFGVLKLVQTHATPSKHGEECTREQMQAHIDARVGAEYPETEHGGIEGEIPHAIREMLDADAPAQGDTSAFEMKQATMPDMPDVDATNLFQGVRPTMVTDEGDAHNTFSKESIAEAALSEKVNIIDLPVSSTFEKQFVSQYMCRIFPWALNYDCGGADYPELFSDWSWFERSIARTAGAEVVDGLQERWRRIQGEAPLLPGEYARMLACRPEMQVAGDWMCVPAARNLHWRYAVLHSAFLVCKQKVAPGEAMHENLQKLMDSLQKIWQKISDNAVQIDNRKVPINGNVGLLFSDKSIDTTDRLILRSYMNVTKNISGCQALRQRIGHILFGFRCCFGECIFVTVSPNRRHSSLILRLSRCRRNDPMLAGRDQQSADKSNRAAYWRHRYASAQEPKFFTNTNFVRDPDGEEVQREIELPEWLVRQLWLSQDPIASVHHYQVVMRILVPAAFGLRMCMQCPDCNADCNTRDEAKDSCSDYLGNNNKSMGGYAGIATAMAFANEFQGDGTPHGHGFVALANAYQFNSLQHIADLLEQNIHELSPADMVQRITSFIEHLHREDHFNDEAHQGSLRSLEEEFHSNNFGHARNEHLSVRPAGMHNSAAPDGSAWSPVSSSLQEVQEDASRFIKEYEGDVQFIFSRVQHHWHKLDKEGKRLPMQYCMSKRRGKKHQCKSGFPKRVIKDKTGKVSQAKYRTRIVCAGVAAEVELRTSGRRNMLGAVLGRRRCAWFSGTSAILAHLMRSNTNVQCPISPTSQQTHP